MADAANRPIPYLSLDRPIVDDAGKPAIWFVEAFNNLVLRTGGQTTDAVAAVTTQAAVAQSQAAAVTAGAVPTSYTLDPADPLSYQAISLDTVQIIVAAHTRTEGATVTSLPGGLVTPAVGRPATYYVFYVTLGIYLASTNPADVTAVSGRLIGSISISAPPLINLAGIS